MSKYYVIPQNLLENDDDESLENCNILTNYVKDNLLNQIKDGDMLGPLEDDRYRNSGCYFWDEHLNSVVCLSADLDDYGCLPESFDITRFEIHHFDKVLYHNNYVRIPKNYIEQIMYTAVYDVLPKDLNITNKSEKAVWAYFFINNQTYYIVGVPLDVGYTTGTLVGANEYGLVVEMSENKELNSVEYAVDFMKKFIINVYNGFISSVPLEEGYPLKDNVMYINC